MRIVVVAPGAVGGEPVKQVIEADLRAEPRSQPGKAVLADSSTEVAADPHHNPWKIGEAFDHRPAFPNTNITRT